ncbi:NAD(P)/FAD-dependent oxidoreductase [Rhizobium sp. G21]|uniref:NAD(P)/FAD-dependent oxidoreductase n=1 Tax=Rhizobium sp. G21 TaxID=2758439 RepID=UPI0015FF20F1|nr:NAD(P)-binding protein [Rhizobium sp. G21]MBB1251367.1 NAD(P)-binding protein [Rhizobium sp. G21]
MDTKIAVIGAGLAGLTLASRLQSVADVTLFEKSRGLGGRMAERRRGDHRFDHGAQYFTARDPAFLSLTAEMTRLGATAMWPVMIDDRRPGAPVSSEARYVGTPGMNGMARRLGRGLNITLETEISAIQPDDRRWLLVDKAGAALGVFDWVISTAPAPQTARLMPSEFSAGARLAQVRMSGCFTLMIGLDRAPELNAEAIRAHHPVVGWIALNSSKPGRDGPPCLVVHSRNDWADTHMENDRDWIEKELLAGVVELTGEDFSNAPHRDLHRWRFANVETPLGAPFLIDAGLGLAAAGDWCLGGRVECAFQSASSLSQAIAKHLGET